MSAASKFRDSLKEQHSVDLNWQEWGPGQENIRVYPKRLDTHPGMTDHRMNHRFPDAKIMLDSGGKVTRGKVTLSPGKRHELYGDAYPDR